MTPSADVLRQHSLQTRNIWGQCPAVHLSDGMLVRKLFDTNVAQMVVPHRLRKPFFGQSHSGPLAANLGAQRTFLQLKSAHYWPGMKCDVIRWCREYEVCAQCNGPPTRRQGRLQKVLTGAPLDIIAVMYFPGYQPRLMVKSTSWYSPITLRSGHAPSPCQMLKHLHACGPCMTVSLRNSVCLASYTAT